MTAPPTLVPPAPRWAPVVPVSAAEVAALQEALRLPRSVCAVLARRGLADVGAAKAHLRPVLDGLSHPEVMVDLRRAADRIVAAIRSGETIFVHGDYDVDGISATALCTRWLRRLGGDVVPFVPDRMRHGYDFGPAGLQAARDAAATVVVTVDCGIVAFETVERATSEGMDVIVTDHHTVESRLPRAFAVVNPNRPDCGHPDRGLCGTGVAFKLCALVGELMGTGDGDVLEYLDLVALATVADLVPLRGENRILVRHGLRRMSHTGIAGLRALLEVAGVSGESVDVSAVGYGIAPRINAAGRMGDATTALELLLTDDPARAGELARELDALNKARKDEDRRTLDGAMEVLTGSYDPLSDFGVVVVGEGWHPGVIGIVASRVVERIHRPTVMVALDGKGGGRGSARSIPGFHVYEALHACRKYLRRFGGHEQAAGMDIDAPAVPEFRAAFREEASRRMEGVSLEPVLEPEVELGLDEADLDLAHWLGYLGPHGMGNRQPVFMARAVHLQEAREVGHGHLKVRLADGASRLDGIGFGLAHRIPPGSLGGGPHDVLFRLERNEWKGRPRAQARVLDLRPAEGRSS